MTAYVLRDEKCFMPATQSGLYQVPARDFNFAIRREDGLLVFRVMSLREANEILDRLSGEVEKVA